MNHRDYNAHKSLAENARYVVTESEGVYTVSRNGSPLATSPSATHAYRLRNDLNRALDNEWNDEVTSPEDADEDAGLAETDKHWGVVTKILAFFVIMGLLGFLFALATAHWFGDVIAELLGGAS